MTRTTTKTLFVSIAILLAGCTAGPGAGPAQAELGDTNAVLTEEEGQSLQFMREEEKLARDVYLSLSERWDHPTFANIAQSEQRHMDAVGGLIESYGLEDPVGDNPPGVFTNTDLQALYDDLIESGQVSLVEALKVGALIEETDIFDLDRAIEQTPQQDIAFVYENLRDGSYNHLRAFDRALDSNGADYTPVVITQQQYDAILQSSPSQGGNGGGGGMGWRGGR